MVSQPNASLNLRLKLRVEIEPELGNFQFIFKNLKLK